MKKLASDIKFIIVTLFLAGISILLLVLMSSSPVGAEDLIGEYTGENGENTWQTVTGSSTDTATANPQTTAASTSATKQTATTASTQSQMSTVKQEDVGTTRDPLVTLSYLKNIFASELKEAIIPEIASSVLSKIVVEPAAKPQETNSNTVVNNSASVSYVVIELKNGQKIHSKNGSVEVIVRPGSKAVVISPYSNQGLADITDGNEIMNGEEIAINHNILIPRADERGILIVSSSAYLMVRGEYEIYE